MAALSDISKLSGGVAGGPAGSGTIAGWALEEGEEDEKEEEVEYADSEIEQAMRDDVDTRCQTDQDVLIRRMEDSIRVFDDDLQTTVEQKKNLATKLKYAEIKIITLYEELQIIRSTQPSEDELRRRVEHLGELVTEIDQQVRFSVSLLFLFDPEQCVGKFTQPVNTCNLLGERQGNFADKTKEKSGHIP